MKHGFFGAIGCLLLSASSVLAQDYNSYSPYDFSSRARLAEGFSPNGGRGEMPAATVSDVPAGSEHAFDMDAALAGGNLGPCWWFTSEFLLWRQKSSPAPVPLITTNDNPATIAALNQPGTRILFGEGSGESTSLNWFAGMRFTAGGWIDCEHNFGAEGSGFLMERRNLIFARSTAGGANPVLAIPFNSVVPFLRNPAGETALSNRGFPSTISAHLNSRLWGAELNGLVNIWRCESVQVTGIVGGRYLDLLEHLSLTDTIQDTQRNGLAFVSDDFGTRNQFYGAQIGGRVNWNYCRFQIDATAKVAFGTVHQTMNLTGETTITNGAFGLPTGTTAQGLFVESTNRGRYNRNVFAVVPEASINFGYQLTSCIRPFIGYNWIYLGNAVRPGNQIDRNINPTQQPLIVPPGTLAGQAAPLANFRTGDFWAQGFNLGVEIRY